MAEDWFADVRKHAANAEENVVSAIQKYLGIALRNRDSSLVSFSDPEEVGRVRERFLRKKLALTGSDEDLNAGLDWVKGQMSGDRTKNRVTVYYLLAHYFGKLDLFGGAPGTSAATLGGAAAGIGAAGLAGLAGTSSAPAASSTSPVIKAESASLSGTPVDREPTPVAGSAAGSGSRHPQTALGSSSDIDRRSAASPSYVAGLEDDDRRSGGSRWLFWLLLGLALIALFFLLKGCIGEQSTSGSETVPPTTLPAEPTPSSDATAGTIPAEASAIPEGAGVITGVRDEKPILTVYFESAKSDVSNDMGTAAATLKTYLDANPAAKLAVSGYNDPSGNAAFNAELSKQRAQAVAAALTAAGIPQASVELIKPADATSASVTPEQARRVEVTIQ